MTVSHRKQKFFLPDTMGVPEIAARLRISQRRVRQILDSGDLPARRGNKEWIAFKSDVEEYDRLRKARSNWYARVRKERGKLPSVAERSSWYRRNVRARRKLEKSTSE